MSEESSSSDSSGSSGDVRFLGEINPLVDGEILTPGEVDNPISIDGDDDLYKQEEIDAADRWMQQNTARIEAEQEAAAVEQRAARASSPTLTLFGRAVQQTSGSTERAESDKDRRKSKDSDSAESEPEDPKYRELLEKLKKKDEQLKQSQEELLKFTRARCENLERENAELRASRATSSPELPARAPTPNPARTSTPARAPTPIPARVTVLVTEPPQEAPGTLEAPQRKKPGRPNKREREAFEKEEREKAEKAKEAAAGIDLQPLGTTPRSTGRLQELKDRSEKSYKYHGTGSFGGRGSQVTTSHEAGPSSTSQKVDSGERFVVEEDRLKAKALSAGFLKLLEGRERKKLKGRSAEPTAVCLKEYREVLANIAKTHLHTTSVDHEVSYVTQLKYYGNLRQPNEVTEESRITWKSTAALEVLTAWWSQTNLQKALLNNILSEKGAQKFETDAVQLLTIVTRIRPKIAAAIAEYTKEYPPKEYLDTKDIRSVATVLYSVEQLLMCLGDLYLL